MQPYNATVSFRVCTGGYNLCVLEPFSSPTPNIPVCVYVLQRAPAIVRRWVPLVAVAAANCINIPVMRQRELKDGIMVADENGEDLAKSKVSLSMDQGVEQSLKLISYHRIA